jgi:two-component system response regulator YesN
MKILIVEDEYNSREGLAAIIQKTCPQHEVCGKAADGDEGFHMVLERKPDLVFVDIELPQMNGLEMIKKLVEQQVESSFVILSGYAEFDYAQQAIQYGVSEYLLKPITYEKLIRVIQNMEKWQNTKKSGRKKGISRGEILRGVLLNSISDFQEASDILRNTVVPRNLFLLNVYCGANQDRPGMTRILNEFCHTCGFDNVFLSTLPEYNFITALINTAATSADLVRRVDYHLAFELEQGGFRDFTLSLVKPESLDSLPTALEKILTLNSWALSIGNKKVICEEMLPNKDAAGEKSDSGETEQINMEALNAIKDGEPGRLTEINLKLLNQLVERKLSPDQIKGSCVRYVLSVLVCYKEFNVDCVEKMQNMKLFEDIKNCCTRGELAGCLNRLVDMYHSVFPAPAKANSLLVKKTIDYIVNFYGDRVSLEEIATRMKVSPEYISHLFTKEVGISFSDYLKQYRIDVAKKLMKTSDYKIYEIGEKIGYKDPKYFYKMFKDVTGLSPKEYLKKV